MDADLPGKIMGFAVGFVGCPEVSAAGRDAAAHLTPEVGGCSGKGKALWR